MINLWTCVPPWSAAFFFKAFSSERPVDAVTRISDGRERIRATLPPARVTLLLAGRTLPGGAGGMRQHF